MANHIHTSHLGSRHIPLVYDWYFHPPEIILSVFPTCSSFDWHRFLVLVC